MSVMARLMTGVRAGIKGASDAWFGPMQPLVPTAPQTPAAGVVGRAFDYQTGYNLNQRPRGYEPVGFEDLRGMARACDVLRLVIETRKDQMAGLGWNVRVKAEPGEDARRVKATDDQKNRIKMITEFLQSPDKEMSFEQWVRAFLEDHFVIDAPTIYRRPTRGGKLYALELIDGATIAPKLSATGRRPLPPDVAYQQILKGIPAVNYTSDELYYCPRNVSTNHVYGYSPVEQILMTSNIAVRRAIFQLEYYTKGTQPDAFLGVPKEWTIEQLKTYQDWIDSLAKQRRMLRLVPGEFKYENTKDPVLKDEYDDYLNRVICYALNVSPTALVKMMNRAQSESQHDQALEEGAGPTMKWFCGVMSTIIRVDFQSPDLEFDFINDESVDPKVQSEIDKSDVSAGIISLDEAREKRGYDPIGGVAATPMVLVATGYVSIGANIPVEDGGDFVAPDPATLGPDGKPLPVDAKTPANEDVKPGDKKDVAKYEYKPATMVSLAEGRLTKAFNENQPRDENGKWTDGGVGPKLKPGWKKPTIPRLSKEKESELNDAQANWFDNASDEEKNSWTATKVLNISDLYTVQDGVSKAKVTGIGKKKDNEIANVIVDELDGHYVVSDGNHRIESAIAKGKTTIEADIRGLSDWKSKGYLASHPATKFVKLAKVHTPGYRYNAPASARRKTIVKAKATLTRKIALLLREASVGVAAQLGHLSKASTPVDKALSDLDLSSFAVIASSVASDIEQIANEAGVEALARIGVETNNELVNQVFDEAVTYAKGRAAYLVGKKMLDDGTIVDNPNSAYSIDEATRDSLRSTISGYLGQTEPSGSLAEAIENDFAFSEERAQLIAHTEIANANSAGSLAGYERAAASGLEVLKSWSVTDDQCCDACEENEAAGPIALDKPFPSGDMAPLAHPHCRCVLLSVMPDSEEENDE